MKKLLIATIILGSLLTACAVVPVGGRGHGPDRVVIAPILPSIVVLEAEPYYFHSGYYYHYNNSRWFYSQSRSGPWADLPRDRYPKEVRYKDKEGHNRDRDRDNRRDDRGRDDRDHDNRGRDDRDRDDNRR